MEISTAEANDIAKQARAEYEAGLKYRHDREKQWQLAEDFYFNRVKKNLKGKFNVPVPIIPGFVDTWTSKMAKHVAVNYEQKKESEYRAVQKANGLLEAQRTQEDYDWDMADTDGKKLAAIYGRAIYRYYAQSKPGYKSTLELIDPYDYVADPLGGGWTERHRFRYIDNIFRSKEELKDLAEAGTYDPAQVSKLINATTADRLASNDTLYQSKQNRLMAIGLDGISHDYAGQALYKLIEGGTIWKGQRVMCVFNYETGIWVRIKPWKGVYKSGLWDIASWATHRDIFNFWSKAPVDDVIPVAEVIRVLANQELDNRNKRNYGQRAYDPEVFPEPAELEWRQDGLVAVKSGTSKVMEIGRGLYTFETPELTGTINLVNWLDSMLKEKTGVNSESQGNTDTSKVGIAYLNVQQSAERTRTTFESYAKCWMGIGRRFLWGLFEHMRQPLAVKILGEKGWEWDEIARIEVNTDWGIRVEGGEDDMNRDEIRKKSARETLATLTPDELAVTNPKWRAKVKFEAAELPDDEIRLAFDLTDDTNREVMSRASQMIEDCLAGKPVKPYRGATTAFVQKLLDFATEQDLPADKYGKLMELVSVHTPIAAENMARKAVQMRAQKGLPPMVQPPASPVDQLMSEEPAPQTPAGTQSQSQALTTMAPNAPTPGAA